MACFQPMQTRSQNGNWLTVACGQCIGCRLQRSQDWATRLTHEASQHAESSFLTLTYAEEHLPWNLSLQPNQLRDFMHRLRKLCSRRYATHVRFFACGEYGTKSLRPHYHLLIFGFGFPDRVPWRTTTAGHLVYRSRELETLWPFGNSEIGTVTKESAGYVSRYCLKKMTGNCAFAHYTRVHPQTGEMIHLEPEFCRMSNRPGIGLSWLRKFRSDVNRNFVTIDGSKRAIPRYYKKKLEEDERDALYLKNLRAAYRHRANNTPARLAVREEVQYRKADLLKREYEE